MLTTAVFELVQQLYILLL